MGIFGGDGDILSVEAINYQAKAKKQYAILAARCIITQSYNGDVRVHLSYDVDRPRFAGSDSLDDCIAGGKLLFDEFQVIKWKTIDEWDSSYEVVYSTSLMEKACAIDKQEREERANQWQAELIRNEEELKTIPPIQILYTFSSGPKPYLLLKYNIIENRRDKENQVSAQICFSDSSGGIRSIIEDHHVWIHGYISSNNRILKKKFVQDHEWKGYKRDELELVASRFIEYKKELKRLNYMRVRKEFSNEITN